MNINTKPLSGFMELTPDQQVEFDRIKHIIEETYNSFGFTSIDTPLVERSEVLQAKGGTETDSQIYYVNNGLYIKEENSQALRFDLTVPLARYVAQHNNQLVFPFRRCHIGKVYRGERAQRGRFREFYQCDIDVIGKNKLSVYYDAEIPSVIYTVFKKLNLGKFMIKISNRKIFNGLLDELKIPASSGDVLRIIDKAQKVSKTTLEDEFKALGLIPPQVEALFKFMEIKGSTSDVINQLKEMDIYNPAFMEGVNELKTVVSTMLNLGVDKDYFEIDLGIVRGLDYYTGTVYETMLEDTRIGSVCSGGRYENLASHYTNESLPGVGISIGLTRLFYKLSEANLIATPPKTIAQIIVIPDKEANLPTAISTSQSLRGAGIFTDLLLEDMPIKKKFAYVDKINAPFTLVVKTLATGEEVLSLQYKEDENIQKQELFLNEIINKIRN